jgi:adenylate kinase family enzyme
MLDAETAERPRAAPSTPQVLTEPQFATSVRLCILGNSGSGKSWLGNEVKKILEMSPCSSTESRETVSVVSSAAIDETPSVCEMMHLDLLHFSSLGSHERRSPADKAAMLDAFYAGNRLHSTDTRTGADTDASSDAASPSWIMEGVFGEYVQDAISKGKATAVLLLDTPFETCKAQVAQRGGNHGTIDTEESREKLFKYAAGYYTRDDARSEKGHLQILQDAKARGLQTAILRSRDEVGRFLHAAKTRALDLLQNHPPPLSSLEFAEDAEDNRGQEGEDKDEERDRKRVRGAGRMGGGPCTWAGPEGVAFAIRAHGD